MTNEELETKVAEVVAASKPAGKPNEPPGAPKSRSAQHKRPQPGVMPLRQSPSRAVCGPSSSNNSQYRPAPCLTFVTERSWRSPAPSILRTPAVTTPSLTGSAGSGPLMTTCCFRNDLRESETT